MLKDRRLQRADLHRTASDSSDTKQRYSIEPTFDEKDGEETMAEERSYTPFVGKRMTGYHLQDSRQSFIEMPDII